MNPLTRTFGRRFKKRYDPLREGDINPATAFDIALSKAAQEVGYSGWPLPQEWLEAALRSRWRGMAMSSRDRGESATTCGD